MRVKDETLLAIAQAVHPSVYPIIERDRTLSITDLKKAIWANPRLPKIMSERSLSTVLQHICEM